MDIRLPVCGGVIAVLAWTSLPAQSCTACGAAGPRTSSPSGTLDALHAVWGPSDERTFFVGDNGSIYRRY
jgi:hypothetical protein